MQRIKNKAKKYSRGAMLWTVLGKRCNLRAIWNGRIRQVYKGRRKSKPPSTAYVVFLQEFCCAEAQTAPLFSFAASGEAAAGILR